MPTIAMRSLPSCSGDDPNRTPWNEIVRREDVEQYFMLGTLSYMIGWGWILFSRDLYVPYERLIVAGLSAAIERTRVAPNVPSEVLVRVSCALEDSRQCPPGNDPSCECQPPPFQALNRVAWPR